MSELRTPKQILKDCNIKVDALQEEKPMLLNSIVRAMGEFADQYYQMKKAKEVDTTSSNCNIKHVSGCFGYPKDFEEYFFSSYTYNLDTGWIHKHKLNPPKEKITVKKQYAKWLKANNR